MAEANAGEVPEGAAVFPLIPAELGVDPLLLAVVHATIFLAGSDEDVVQPDAADEAVEYMASYLQRLSGARLERVREDMAAVASYARAHNWPKQLVRVLKTFLTEYGIGQGDKA